MAEPAPLEKAAKHDWDHREAPDPTDAGLLADLEKRHKEAGAADLVLDVDDGHGETAEDDVLGIDHVPVPGDFAWLRGVRRHGGRPTSIHSELLVLRPRRRPIDHTGHTARNSYLA